MVSFQKKTPGFFTAFHEDLNDLLSRYRQGLVSDPGLGDHLALQDLQPHPVGPQMEVSTGRKG